MTLKEYLNKAKEEHWAVGHFNFSTADQLRAFVEAAAEAKAPLMVATSEGEADFFGMDQAVALVRSYQAEGHVVWLNADHFKSFEKCKAAIDAGYDSILIDASKLPYEENVALTKQVVEYARSVNPEILVEGELGYLRGSSEVQQKVAITPADYTQPNLAFSFVNSTKVDRLAVVFGNIHGIVTEQKERLDIEHFKHIVRAVSDPGLGPFPKVSLVLHGASGLKAEDVQAAIADLDELYKSCPSDKKLVDCAEITSELTVKNMNDINTKVTTQGYKPPVKSGVSGNSKFPDED